MALDVKRIRESLQMTQQEIADLMGIHFTSYSQTERGRTEPSYEFICRLAEATGQSTEALLFEDGKRSRPPLGESAGDWWIARIRLALRGLTEEQIQTVIGITEAAAIGLRQREQREVRRAK